MDEPMNKEAAVHERDVQQFFCTDFLSGIIG